MGKMLQPNVNGGVVDRAALAHVTYTSSRSKGVNARTKVQKDVWTSCGVQDATPKVHKNVLLELAGIVARPMARGVCTPNTLGYVRRGLQTSNVKFVATLEIKIVTMTAVKSVARVHAASTTSNSFPRKPNQTAPHRARDLHQKGCLQDRLPVHAHSPPREDEHLVVRR